LLRRTLAAALLLSASLAAAAEPSDQISVANRAVEYCAAGDLDDAAAPKGR